MVVSPQPRLDVTKLAAKEKMKRKAEERRQYKGKKKQDQRKLKAKTGETLNETENWFLQRPIELIKHWQELQRKREKTNY